MMRRHRHRIRDWIHTHDTILPLYTCVGVTALVVMEIVK